MWTFQDDRKPLCVTLPLHFNVSSNVPACFIEASFCCFCAFSHSSSSFFVWLKGTGLKQLQKQLQHSSTSHINCLNKKECWLTERKQFQYQTVPFYNNKWLLMGGSTCNFTMENNTQQRDPELRCSLQTIHQPKGSRHKEGVLCTEITGLGPLL